jgi:hypothetical protein
MFSGKTLAEPHSFESYHEKRAAGSVR